MLMIRKKIQKTVLMNKYKNLKLSLIKDKRHEVHTIFFPNIIIMLENFLLRLSLVSLDCANLIFSDDATS